MLAHPGCEQLHRFKWQQLLRLNALDRLVGWQGKGRQGVFVFASQEQGNAAGGKNLQAFAAPQQSADFDGSFTHLFTIVEDKQQLSVRQ